MKSVRLSTEQLFFVEIIASLLQIKMHCWLELILIKKVF